MRRKLVAVATAGLLTLGGLAGCDDDDAATASGGVGKVGVILPDTTTSQRWGSDDPKLLKAAFEAADVPVDIRNAQGDVANFAKIADEMIAGGAKVLMIVSLDSVSGRAVLEKAKAAGVKTIDYDRLTLNGGADYHVSFDNVEVGRLQGQGLVKCLKAKGVQNPRIVYLNGAPTDNNATLFREGYDEILQAKYDEGTYLKGPEQSVPRWNNDDGRFIFEQMWSQTEGKIDGVLAANDGLGNAAITVLKRERVNGTIPVTGQDAETQGLQNILAGDQCMTVYKPIKKEADAAAKLAISLFRGERATDADSRVKDPESGGYVDAVLLKPTAIFKKDVGKVIADGFVSRRTVCTGAYAAFCTANGIA
ncbi:sugar ABC transporter substrate-binding protein [Amorphoplanes digitatis]|uniref:D-xylose transport system substrate-binding protein n=1 Tax=Actinoplanes digitatis TaxID=1868 RepID=A0A7W7HXW7_9ACTN|nr:substrate-binding domain-containing protein [Actinoplanes digitatis]MBB4762708.1 D-xylose transport system substrate-binding protein [Actinoplanes digitatis]GID91795.1 sugar ABC transporter substrate-binding protein [Actinoplanes digitatis]